MGDLWIIRSVRVESDELKPFTHAFRSQKWETRPESSSKRLFSFPTLAGCRQTARKAAVTALRGNGGTFPSRPHKSGLKRRAVTGRRGAAERVTLQASQV